MEAAMKKRIVNLMVVTLVVTIISGCGTDRSASANTTVSVDTAVSADATESADVVQNNRPDRTAAFAPEIVEEKDYAEEILQEELDSISVGKLSPDHEFYEEVVTMDPECAEYINEISIYDKEIDDTFVVHISLPPNYNEDTQYPMLVMTDGVWRLSDHPQLRSMMVNGEIEDIILVSIGYPNGYDYRTIRERDLVKDPTSYLHFIVDNLIPYLEDNYSISPDNMTLAGHSYGGYWAYYALFHSDTIGKNTFANYYIGSPSLQAYTGTQNLYSFEEEYYERSQTLQANVYVTVGGEESAPFITAIEDFDELIYSRNYAGLSLTYEVIPDNTHDTVFKPSIRNTVLMFYGK